MKVKDIIKPLNLSDVGCDEKIARLNDIFASFSAEIYDLYPMKVIQKFDKKETTTTITTNYPCIHIWGFFGKGCSTACSLDKWDCCAWFRRLLVEEMYWDYLDANAYSLIDENTIKFRFAPGTTETMIVYSRALPTITSLNDDINIPNELVSLLRTYIRSEYALESDNDINMSANYYSRFQTRLNKLRDMYSNSIKFVVPWALQRVDW